MSNAWMECLYNTLLRKKMFVWAVLISLHGGSGLHARRIKGAILFALTRADAYTCAITRWIYDTYIDIYI